MKIQSLSVCVPVGEGKACGNECAFCVAHMHDECYKNQIEKNVRFIRLYKSDYKKRLMFARRNQCNTMMITSDGEALLNRPFLEKLGEWNETLEMPFEWIELQTSGMLLDDEYLRFLRDTVGVSTISLSVSSIFSSKDNALYNRPKADKYFVDIDKVCAEIKRYDFNLRLSLNMTDFYNDVSVEDIFKRLHELQANQVTFRVLYKSDDNTPQDRWIDEHRASDEKIKEIEEYIIKNGTNRGTLPFGAIKYSVHNIGTVIDGDCMATEIPNTEETFKYLILRPDAKLYSDWKDKGSLIF